MHLDVLDWIVLACGAPFVLWLALPSKKHVQRAGQRWAREWSAYVPPELVPAFDRRTKLDSRITAMLLAVLLAALVSPLGDGRDLGRFLAVATVAFLPALVWRARHGIAALPPASPTRVARARPTIVTDYVPRWAFGLLVVSAAIPAGLLVNPHRHGSLSFAVAAQAVNCVVAAAALARVARASLPAADETELYLRDADRASAMTSLLNVPAWTAFTLMQVISFDATHYSDTWSFASIATACALLAAAQALDASTKKRFQSRLWSDRAAAGVSVAAGQAASS